jgi:hypothetical protein
MHKFGLPTAACLRQVWFGLLKFPNNNRAENPVIGLFSSAALPA